eukprot:COSAG01_NODE_954_length_12493_cov_8.138454_4_plen_171_part_00
MAVEFRHLRAALELPGSKRPYVIRIQTRWRMEAALRSYRQTRAAQHTIAEAVRARRARKLFELEKARKKEAGFDFASRTVHVGGIGGVWETVPLGEQLLQRRFSTFGPVLVVVLRYRTPEKGVPHNSWALVTFTHLRSIDNLWARAEKGGLTVMVDAQDCNFKVGIAMTD